MLPKIFPALRTKRLELVQVGQQYVKDFFDMMSRDEVTTFYGVERLQAIEEAEQIIDSFRQVYEQQRGIRWGIILKETDEFCGTIGLNHLHMKAKKAEISFELHPDQWNRGIMTDA